MWSRSFETHGHVARGWLGVQIQSLTPEIAASVGVKDAKGAIVANVVPGSPAAKAGFAQGDVVLALNGTAIEDFARPDAPRGGVACGCDGGVHRSCATATQKTLQAPDRAAQGRSSLANDNGGADRGRDAHRPATARGDGPWPCRR